MLFAFGTTQSVEIIDPGALNLGSRGQAKSAAGLSFTPDDILVDNDGNLLLLSIDNLSIFRWSTSEKSYLETIPLVSPPISMTFSTELNRIYTGYGTSEIRMISLDDPIFSEKDFVETPSAPHRLEAAGDILFVGYSDPRGGSLYFFATYRADGTSISKRGDKQYSNEYVWNPATRRFFHLRDGISPNDLLWQSIAADGSLGPNKESPYHGDYVFKHPIRVNPEGSRVLTGAGNVFKAETLVFDIAIPFSISDAIWTGENEVITVREFGGMTQLQRLSGANLTPQATAPFSGTPIRLLKTTPEPTLITLVDGVPRYFLIDPVSLEATYVSPTKPIAPLAVGTTTRTVQSVTVIWRDKSDNEEGFRIQYRVRGTDSWQDGLSTGSDAEDGTVAGLVVATEYEFRIIAFNPGFDSDPSEAISATTLSDPNAPTGEPFNLIASRIFQDRITLEWTDNADNELEFILYRLEAPEAVLSSGVRIVLPANTTSYEDTGLLSNRIHYYRIQVSNASSVGDTSAAISARTRPSAASPTPPQGSALAAVDTASATLAWSDTSTNEEGFIIRRAPATAQNSYQEIGRVGYNETTFIDTAVTPAQSYYYEILAYNQIGSRADSQKVQVEIPARGGSFTNHAIRHGDIYYLTFTRPNRVERFDLESDSWLPPLPLSEVPSALWVDDDGIYVGMGRRAVKILDDGRESQIAATSSRIHSIIATVDGFLMVSDGASNILTIRKSDASLVVTFEGDFSVGGLSRAEGSSRVFGRTINRSPEEMLYLDFNSDGTVKDQKDSPEHGDYPPAERTFTFPDGRRVTDDSGTVYNATNLRFHGSLGGELIDMEFLNDDVFFVLRQDAISAYGSTLLATGSISLEKKAVRITRDRKEILAFTLDGTSERGIGIARYPIEDIDPNIVVNEPPMAEATVSRTANEDDPELRIKLSDFITDKEDAELTFRITGNTIADGLLDRFFIEGDELVLIPTSDAFGSATIEVTGRDSEGLEAISQITATILPIDDRPTVTDIPDLDGPADGSDLTEDFSSYFADADPGDILTYSISENSNPTLFSSLEIDPGTGVLRLKFADYLSGTAKLTLKAIDQVGLDVVQNFEIILPDIPQPSLLIANAPALNRRTGLLEHVVTVTNLRARSIGGFVITADTQNTAKVYNSSEERDNGLWIIRYDTPVPAEGSVDVTLEYHSPTRSVGQGLALTVEHALPLNRAPVTDDLGLVVDRVISLDDGAMVLEFATTPGVCYSVQYSPDGQTWHDSLVRLRAGGTRVQWIDRGAPKTPTPPGDTASRFYRVIEKN